MASSYAHGMCFFFFGFVLPMGPSVAGRGTEEGAVVVAENALWSAAVEAAVAEVEPESVRKNPPP